MPAAQMQQQLVVQLDAILAEFHELRDRADNVDMSGLPEDKLVYFLTRARAAIHRVAGRPSVYVDQCEEIVNYRANWRYKVRLISGVVNSLRSDMDAGYIQSYTEIVHGELFADFIEMSQHLLNEGFKDASAVIAGSSLEAHLRQICQKSGIDTTITTAVGTSSKKADRLNADLAGANVYSKLDLKNVTAWLDLRNKAAHGHYDQYQKTRLPC